MRSKITHGLIGLWILAILIIAFQHRLVSLDTYWHLQMGLDWLEKGWSPFVDHYSFTYEGQAMRHCPYLFQVMLGLCVRALGFDQGCVLFWWASWASILCATWFWCTREPTHPMLRFTPILLALLLANRMPIRPEVFSFPCALLAVILMRRAGPNLSTRGALGLMLLLVVWVNLHTSSIFGYLLVGSYYFDVGLHQLRRSTWGWIDWLRWLGLGLASLAVGFLNPTLYHPILEVLSFDPGWSHLVAEYAPVKLQPLQWGVVVAMAFSVVAMSYRRHLGHALATLVLAWLAIRTGRLFGLCAFIWACLAIDALRRHRLPNLRPAWFWAIGLLLGLEMVRLQIAPRPAPLRFPTDVVSYLNRTKPSARIFNEYGAGGFLIHRLDPRFSIYIDGRTHMLYPFAHAERYFQALASTSTLSKEIERYRIDLLLLPNEVYLYRLVGGLPGFRLAFMGRNYASYDRKGQGTEDLFELMRDPYCWHDEYMPAYLRQAEIALKRNHARSEIAALAEFLMRFDASVEPTELLAVDPGDDLSRRLASKLALHLGNADRSYALLSLINSKHATDYVRMAAIAIEMRRYDLARSVVSQALREKPFLSEYNRRALKSLGLELGMQHRELDRIDPETDEPLPDPQQLVSDCVTTLD